MVQLTRIYTKSGDKGKTSLGNGKRVAKSDIRVAAYGTVDETNAVIGVARLHSADTPDIDAMLARIQNDLFDLGADLCTPGDGTNDEGEYPALRIAESQVTRLEHEIDAINANLNPLKSRRPFVISTACRTICLSFRARPIMAERTTFCGNRALPAMQQMCKKHKIPFQAC